jgi:thiamine-monophosphate kinase
VGRPASPPLSALGARGPGDRVYLSGNTGEAAAGLRLAQILSAFVEAGLGPTRRFPELSPEHQRRLLERYHDPIRASAGAFSPPGASRARRSTSRTGSGSTRAASRGRPECAWFSRPIACPSPAPLRAFAAMADQDALELALSGGDDYELLFTVPEERVDALERAVSGKRARGHADRDRQPGSGAGSKGPRASARLGSLGHDHLGSRERAASRDEEPSA